MPRPAVTHGLTVIAALAAGLFRLIPFGLRPPNFAPIGALGLYSGGRVSGRSAWLLPLAVMAVTDFLLAELRGYAPFDPSVYLGFLGYVAVGRWLARRDSLVALGSAGFLGAAQFFLITNAFHWLGPYSEYPPTAAGLLACYAAGLPFFGYTLAGDWTFSAVLFGAHALAVRTAEAPAREVS